MVAQGQARIAEVIGGLSLATDLAAAEASQALTEERLNRPAHAPEDAAGILAEQARARPAAADRLRPVELMAGWMDMITLF